MTAEDLALCGPLGLRQHGLGLDSRGAVHEVVAEEDLWSCGGRSAVLGHVVRTNVDAVKMNGSLAIHGYAGVWGFELDEYQVYARFILPDSVTGYRSQFQEYATVIRAKKGTSTVQVSQEG